jgi:outer membrane lipoprotein-sorting protein
MRRASFVVFALLFWCSPVVERTSVAAQGELDGHQVIQRMMERNPALSTFRARVHVDIHMVNFPYLSPKLDGTSYFKRPDNYEVVFDRVPGYAKGFSRLFDDVGDPTRWEMDQDVVFLGTAELQGKSMLVLRLTKKIYSTILDHALVYVDPSTYELAQMEWHYRSGGTVVMTQSYRSEGGYVLISSQHATIDIPHVRAVAQATYSTYETNVALDPSVFDGKR